MNKIKTKYVEFLIESRYKTHGLSRIKRIIPNLLKSYKVRYNIDYNEDSDDFQLYIYSHVNLDILLSRCELIGYFPSIFEIDNLKCVSGNTIDDFVENIKNYKLPKFFKQIYIQFESWIDEDVELPDKLYHVYRKIDLNKILRYGISPKSKHKISFHPDRIYLTDDLKSANLLIKQFNELENNEYSILEIKPKKDLLIRKDPNFDNGYYTTQNIPPNWIINN